MLEKQLQSITKQPPQEIGSNDITAGLREASQSYEKTQEKDIKTITRDIADRIINPSEEETMEKGHKVTFEEMLQKISDNATTKYPEYSELIHSLIETRRLLYTESEIERCKRMIADRRVPYNKQAYFKELNKKLWLNLTQSMSILTNTLLDNIDNPEIGKNLWEGAHILAKKYGLSKDSKENIAHIDGIKRGVTGQVAVHLLLKSVGLETTFSSCEQDSFEATDELFDYKGQRVAVSVKSKENLSQPIIEIIKKPQITPAVPDSRFQKNNTTYHAITGNVQEQMSDFAKVLPKNHVGLYINIPARFVHQETGEISPTQLPILQNLIKTELNKL